MISSQKTIEFAELMLLTGFRKGSDYIWMSLAEDDPFQSSMGLGAGAYMSEDYSPAKKHFKNALERSPDNYEATLALGYTLLELGTIDEALTLFEKAAIHHPSKRSSLAARGRAHARKGDFELAHQLLGQAALLEEHNYDAWIDFARCCGAIYDANGMVEAYNAALKCDPERIEAYLELSHLQIMNDDFESASRVFTLGWRDHNIREPLFFIRAAQVEEYLGDHELALYLIQEAAPLIQTDDPQFNWTVLWNEVFDTVKPEL